MAKTPANPCFKTLSATLKQDENGDGREFTFTFSSEEPDRDNDIIVQSGIDLTRFRENPVVLWAHNQGFTTPPPPVARVLRTWLRDNRLMGTLEFPVAGIHALADTLRGLVSTGFLNAVSIGFRVLKWTFDEDRDGFDFLETELFELSLVPVPANADALIEATLAEGTSLKPLAEWVEQTKSMLDKLDAAGNAELVAESPDLVPALASPVVEPVLDFAASVNTRMDEVFDSFEKKLAQYQPSQQPSPIQASTSVLPVTTTSRSMTDQERDTLKGVVKAALRDTAVSEVRNHTGRLED